VVASKGYDRSITRFAGLCGGGEHQKTKSRRVTNRFMSLLLQVVGIGFKLTQNTVR